MTGNYSGIILRKYLLYNAISGEEYQKITSGETAKEIWDKLEVTYEGNGKSSRL